MEFQQTSLSLKSKLNISLEGRVRFYSIGEIPLENGFLLRRVSPSSIDRMVQEPRDKGEEGRSITMNRLENAKSPIQGRIGWEERILCVTAKMRFSTITPQRF